jgi:hypothetical protein
MTPTVGRIVHVIEDLNTKTTVCMAAIITAVYIEDFQMDLTEFPPFGPWQDAAKRLPRVNFSGGHVWHYPWECSR